ncbi:hypothetical protein PVK06_020820 [Gossypium arboreum]|uniref:Uncharacterized protein n=1 Tax=Gossypium arboreum TaxID=29729 RepID=A0ABR0PNC9_GOSAR|nr:hypothetical protein PVK06_020820 [Gossypium arboreum]
MVHRIGLFGFTKSPCAFHQNLATLGSFLRRWVMAHIIYSGGLFGNFMCFPKSKSLHGRFGNETIIHALIDCPKARAVLSFGELDGCLLDYPYESCIDWLEDAICLLDHKAFDNLITVLWTVWNGRNNALFQGKEDDVRLVWEWEWARTLGDDFNIFNLSHCSVDAAVLDLAMALGLLRGI